jgi:hypothetical protein
MPRRFRILCGFVAFSLVSFFSVQCYLPVTWRDEPRLPCGKLVDASRRRCGRPSSFSCSNCCRRSFPPLLCKKSCSLFNLGVAVHRILFFTLCLISFICAEVTSPLFFPVSISHWKLENPPRYTYPGRVLEQFSTSQHSGFSEQA